LTRTDNAFALITDLVFAVGRFISTSEGLDTDQPGWELRVKVMELHNSATINELGRRVRRGQLGRVHGNLSAGDLPYGYESFFIDPEAAANPGRGPKVHHTEVYPASLLGGLVFCGTCGARVGSEDRRNA
jgi:hypothetical protein